MAAMVVVATMVVECDGAVTVSSLTLLILAAISHQRRTRADELHVTEQLRTVAGRPRRSGTGTVTFGAVARRDGSSVRLARQLKEPRLRKAAPT
jgi:hypothetical protein